jgi:hypothetical protein
LKKAISTEQSPETVGLVLEVLRATPTRLKHLCRGLSEARLREPLGAGERSFTEVLAHLVNVEDRSSEAIKLALLAKEPELAVVHPERQLGQLMRHEQLGFHDLLTYFRIRRTLLTAVLRGLNDRHWSRTLREAGKQRRESVYWRARTIAMHELEHLADIERKLNRSS